MSRTVFANSRNFSHKGSGDKSLSASPDICKTPVGSATPPIPYPVLSNATDSDGYTSSVLIDGNPTAIASSVHTTCSGGEAGSAKGVISGTTADKTEFTTYSYDIKCEGEGVVRHDDKTTMNSGNTTGAIQGTSIGAEDVDQELIDTKCVIDFYITDFEEELRINKVEEGQKIYLNVRSRNMIGDDFSIKMPEQNVNFLYEGKALEDNTIDGHTLNANHEKIELEVVSNDFTPTEASSESLLGKFVVRMALSDDEADGFEDTFILRSEDGSYSSIKTVTKNAERKTDYVDLMFSDMDKNLSYTLEHKNKDRKDPHFYFENVNYANLSK